MVLLHFSKVFLAQILHFSKISKKTIINTNNTNRAQITTLLWKSVPYSVKIRVKIPIAADNRRTASERMIITCLISRYHRQHDLKGRMPERSEWLVAGGVAKRNPRYHNAHQDAKNANIGFLVDCFRVFLFSGMFSILGVALRLTPG